MQFWQICLKKGSQCFCQFSNLCLSPSSNALTRMMTSCGVLVVGEEKGERPATADTKLQPASLPFKCFPHDEHKPYHHHCWCVIILVTRLEFESKLKLNSFHNKRNLPPLQTWQHLWPHHHYHHHHHHCDNILSKCSGMCPFRGEAGHIW